MLMAANFLYCKEQMINKSTSQKRKNPRAEVTWPVTVISKQSVLQGMVKNLSCGGALLYMQEQIDFQESIRIAIELPEYNDVISVVGKVVRTFPLEKSIEHFAFAVGVIFTEISEENLKFFTGNLAPEWHKDYKQPQKISIPRHDFKRNIIYGTISILIFSLLFYAIRVNNGDKIDSRQIAVFESRLKTLESQLNILQEVTASNRNLEEQLHSIQNELADLKNNFATVTRNEQLQAQASSSQEKNVDISSVAVMKSSESLKTDLGKEKTLPPSAVYHVVKKGETLYRIALMYRLDINEIRELNNLSSSSSIYPNQKLLVQ